MIETTPKSLDVSFRHKNVARHLQFKQMFASRDDQDKNKHYTRQKKTTNQVLCLLRLDCISWLITYTYLTILHNEIVFVVNIVCSNVRNRAPVSTKAVFNEKKTNKALNAMC